MAYVPEEVAYKAFVLDVLFSRAVQSWRLLWTILITVALQKKKEKKKETSHNNNAQFLLSVQRFKFGFVIPRPP